VFTAAAIMSVLGALVSLLRGKQFYYDDAVQPAPKTITQTITPNGPSLTSANGDSVPVAGAADHTGQRAGG
jgi:hypothetical protein